MLEITQFELPAILPGTYNAESWDGEKGVCVTHSLRLASRNFLS